MTDLTKKYYMQLAWLIFEKGNVYVKSLIGTSWISAETLRMEVK